MSETYWLERAWLGDGPVVEGVRVSIEAGRFTNVESDTTAEGAHRLAGLTIPGMANCHSHAFHRALRGRTQRERGTFWTWREQMYDVARLLNPDNYYHLARATYREMLASGYTSVGEFHYLHHAPDGTPYDDPNAMGLAVVEAARDAGIRITLLDTCYVASGIGSSPEGVQRRFSDGDASAWASRLERLEYVGDERVVLGTAIHSVRAVPRDQLHVVAAWAEDHGAPLHVHLSEQVEENEACLAAYGQTPTAVLAAAGVLRARTTAVHATHLTDSDIAMLGGSHTYSCLCPTTERDLADGVGPSRLLHEAGSSLTLGTDSHAVVDAFEEMRAVELDERLVSRERGSWSASELMVAATRTGHRSLGFPDGGVIATGAHADLVTLDTSSPRTAGTGADLESAVFAASAADVVHVVADGKVVVTRKDHPEIGDELRGAISNLGAISDLGRQ